jgi:hypothetical protein
MRTTLALLFALTSAVAWSQMDDQKIESALNSVPTQAVVTVRKHNMGADLVEITMLDAKYPLDLLRSQVEKIGEYAGASSRGISVGRTSHPNPKQQFTKASFATNNLIEDETGKIRLEPFAKAFSGAPKPYTIQAFVVSFEGLRPTERTLKTYGTKAVALSGRAIPPPFGGLEYRVVLFSQKPEEITIPDEHKESPPPPAKATPTAPAADEGRGLRVVLIVVAALAAGALVYFLLARPGRTPIDRSSPRRP